MTDIVKLAQRLHRRIQWQEIPEVLTSDDLIDIVCDAIRMLYVISGRTFQFSEDMFVDTRPEEYESPITDDDHGNASFEDPNIIYTDDGDGNVTMSTGEEPTEDGVWFTADLMLDEQEWVLLESEIAFYNMVLSNVDDLQSYTTDAMSVTHGDKPFKNIRSTVEDRQMKQAIVWTRMVRFNQLGVSG